jgi:hypothetical protein
MRKEIYWLDEAWPGKLAVAVASVSAARGMSVPETAEQRDWVDHYAVGLTAAK